MTVIFMVQLYLAGAYLLLMPLAGILVHYTHGGRPRRLLDERVSPFPRIVIVADSLNGSEWRVFYGGSYLLNSLLNKPLYSSDHSRPELLRALLRLSIVSQWVLAVGSCALQEWNAFMITFWIVFCALVYTYAYPPESSVQDWMRHNCDVIVKRIQAEFSSRRSMLSAMVHLNPDSKEKRTDWINPILASSSDRYEWETTLLAFMESGNFALDPNSDVIADN